MAGSAQKSGLCRLTVAMPGEHASPPGGVRPPVDRMVYARQGHKCMRCLHGVSRGLSGSRRSVNQRDQVKRES